MIDFNKKIVNSDKFRQAALFFEKNGCYTFAPEGTTDYFNYWKQEQQRCLNGYTAPDGDQITGYHYFYLNYSPIMKLVETEYTDRNGTKRTRRERLFRFPDFWDYDWFYYNAIEQAEDEGKHMVVLKARARGYSFKGASMLCRNYFLIPKSKNFAVASEQKFLTGDGLLTKAWQIMDFLDKYSGWAKRRLRATSLERTSGFKVKDEITGKEVEDGYLSSVTGITLKNDPERIRGTRGRLFLWEESGKFPDIKQAWQIARPSVETDDGVAFGLMIAFGTGGSEGANFEGLSDMFYHPEGFNCLDFDNIWDEGMADKKCGFFVPAWSNLQSEEHPECMDSDGNTNRSASVQVILEQRRIVRDSQPDETVTDRYIAEHPNTPQEAILEVGKNIFPKKQLQMQLNKLRTNTKLANMKHVVDLVWEGDGTVKAIEKKGGDITHYPLKKGEQPTGSVVIYEYPVKDPPYGLYIAGQDPYDQDGSLTNSLGSTFIYKRFQPGEAWSDVIVAEYSGRPDTAEEYYENVRKLLTMYNAKLLFENERKGIYPYFTNKHCDYMLADQPDKVISEIFKDSKVQRKKGCHMTKQIRSYAEGLIKEWLLEEYEPGHPNLERIYSEPLIEELLLDDGVRNVDRVIALCMVMLYREELYQVKIAAAKEQNKQIDFFETPLFSNQWFDEDSSYDNQYDNNIPTFTF